MRILLYMSHSGHVRNFEWVLRELDSGGHEVHVVVEHVEKGGLPEVNGPLLALAGELRGLRVDPAPVRGRAASLEAGRRLRAAIDYMHYLQPGLRDATKARERAGRLTPQSLRWVAGGSPETRRARAVRAVLSDAERAIPVSRSLRRMLAKVQPDVVLVTPLVEPGSPQIEMARASRASGIPWGLLVASWDNLTMKGLIHDVPDVVIVWNDAQRAEAVTLHRVPDERVLVTGAAAYDHWFAWGQTTRRDEFMRSVGLDPRRPYVLYVGSSPFVAPAEVEHVRLWLDALRSAIPDLQVLVRPHPTNPMREPAAERAAVEEMTGVVVVPEGGDNPTDAARRRLFFDSMVHSAAVVGVNTSALIEGAIAGRPVLTMLTARYRDSQAGMLHFRHLIGENGGMVAVADSFDQHVGQVLDILSEPADATAINERFLASFVRPHGLGVPVAPIVARAVVGLAGAEPLTLPRRSPWRRATGWFVAGLARSVIRSRARRQRLHELAQRHAEPDAPRPEPPTAGAEVTEARRRKAQRAEEKRHNAERKAERGRVGANGGPPRGIAPTPEERTVGRTDTDQDRPSRPKAPR